MVEGREWLEQVSKGRTQEGMPVVKRHQVVEEGLSCLRAGGGSNNSREVGGRNMLQVLQSCCGGAAATGKLVVERQEGLARVYGGARPGGGMQHQQEECL